MRVAIASGKGGTGKTTVSVNLAAMLSESYRVVLADLDVEEPNSGLFLDHSEGEILPAHRMVPEWNKESCTLCGNCQKVCNFNAIIQLPQMVMPFPNLCHGCYACAELCPSGALSMIPERMGEIRVGTGRPGRGGPSFDFVEGKLDVGQEIAVPLIARTIEITREKFTGHDFFIFDSPPGTSCPMIEAVKNTDMILLVTEPTPFGFHDLKLAVETVREMEKPFAVVINKDGIGDNRVDTYCSREGIEIAARLPNDRAIARLYSAGKTIFHTHEGFRTGLETLIAYLQGKVVRA